MGECLSSVRLMEKRTMGRTEETGVGSEREKTFWQVSLDVGWR